MVITAAASIVLHVFNYNATAHLEYNTRIFTKIIGRNAVYFYAAYLIFSALVRDYFIDEAIKSDTQKVVLLSPYAAELVGNLLFAFGLFLNIWTLKALGIKGMYNGDSFGHLMDAPVNDGPYRYLSDPQYVGTTISSLGHALKSQSLVGYVLTVLMWITFWISVKFVEGPHLRRIYSNRKKSKLY